MMIDFFYPPQPKRIWPESSYFKRLDRSPLWAGEIKYNGWRLLLNKNDKLNLFNRHATIIDINPTIFESAFKKVPKNTVFDGELVEFRTTELKNIIVFWDCMFWDGKDLRQLPLSERRKYLKFDLAPEILTTTSHPQIFRTQQFKTGLIDLYNKIVTRNDPVEEGLVIKKIDSPYSWHHSRKVEIDDWIKVKKISDSAKVGS